MSQKPLYINGKFAAQRLTGVQRFATELLKAFDALLPAPGRGVAPIVLLLPPGACAPLLTRIEVRTIGSRFRNLHAWEQCALPWAARDGCLLNLAGSAPWLHRHSVITLHDAAVFEQAAAYTPLFVAWYRFLFRQLSRRCALALTVSEFSRSRLRQHLSFPADLPWVVPNGTEHLQSPACDESVLAAHGLRDTPYLLAVGSANPAKNLRMLLRVFLGLPGAQELRLVVTGGRNEAVFADEPLPQSPRVIYTGRVSDEQLKALYRHALAFVFPSLYEGFGLPPLEAMSCDCPVVAADAAAIPEVCGEAALYFDPRSDASLQEALARVMTDGLLRQELVQAGRSRLLHYRWSRSARLLMSHLQAVRLFPETAS